MIVEHVLTPVPIEGLRASLDYAHHSVFSRCPGIDGAVIALSQIIFEHGRKEGQLTGLWNFNFGNQDAKKEYLLPSPEKSSVKVFRTVPECEGGRCQARQVHWRRAFSTLDDGLEAYWERLHDGWPAAHEALLDGNPELFAEELKKGFYFSGDLESYRHSMRSLFIEFLPKESPSP